jgi:hypothetical protein
MRWQVVERDPGTFRWRAVGQFLFRRDAEREENNLRCEYGKAFYHYRIVDMSDVGGA